jgi:small subunit ribosomal protein S20
MGERTQTRRIRNSSFKSKISRALRMVKDALRAGRPEDECREEFRTLVRTLDIVSNKGIFHKNKAARHKRRMAVSIRLMSGSK